MIIGAYAIGADKGYVYIRAEYPLAVERLKKALDDARSRNLLGKSIMGTWINFDILVKLGAGAFVCGEETALIASIEGQRGMRRPNHRFLFIRGSGENHCHQIMSKRLPNVSLHCPKRGRLVCFFRH